MSQAVRLTLLPSPARRWAMLSVLGAGGIAAAFAAGNGPGTFTGLLVALAIVSGFSALWSP